ncbi:Uncharacterised protein [Campylobacter geochelonis]|uniref:Uncharacterized protein n=1 Tax=Campylobacter geochelonis TaxID=1780362 RepID=A0A128EDQ8_9BACT|nr:Uncharacterised protein [Campylobacter geochelonis]
MFQYKICSSKIMSELGDKINYLRFQYKICSSKILKSHLTHCLRYKCFNTKFVQAKSLNYES